MGGVCGKGSGGATARKAQKGGTLEIMFDRIDRDNKGYIGIQDLEDMMRDDKTHFHGKGASHIMNKYGVDGRMNFEQFATWWNSTYTTYNDDAIAQMVGEAEAENDADLPLEPIEELTENSNVAISRS